MFLHLAYVVLSTVVCDGLAVAAAMFLRSADLFWGLLFVPLALAVAIGLYESVRSSRQGPSPPGESVIVGRLLLGLWLALYLLGAWIAIQMAARFIPNFFGV